ncbi:hypothetical protein O181_086001 [Austropuccinia psidii MF-1]|uniref:Integrase catalytic domain-containing protein n=1 Tax=Austropuccinia psidii MF-1 TaxID=1389203 RepID=A0A9Q3FU14_9BASI|nr:hypothetical protein [Austropuccinia psidii MF-1]
MAEALGTAVILSDSCVPIHLKNSLIVPSITSPLIALSPFLKKNCCLKGEGNAAKLYSEKGELLLNGRIINNIITIKILLPVAVRATINMDPLVLHQALGHPSERYASALYPLVNFSGVKFETCLKSKSHRLPFKGTFPVLNYPLEMVHMDLFGPITPKSRGNSVYSKAFEKFRMFKMYAEKQTGHEIKGVVSNNEGEFISKEFLDYLMKNGIKSLSTAPYSPQQNPISERANRTLMERTRCLLLDSKLPMSWWGEAAATEAYFLNRTPSETLGMKTPFEKFYNRKESWENLHPFGCKVYININRQNVKSKLNPSAQEGVFLGYVEGHKNFKVFNSETGKLQITHDCILLNKEMGSSGNPELVKVKVSKEHFFWLSDCSFKSPPDRVCDSVPPIVLEDSRSLSSSLYEAANQSSSQQMEEESNNEIYHPDPNSSLCFDKSLLLDTSEEDLADIPLTSLSGGEVSGIKELPKGWVMEDVPEIAPKNISSNIDEGNIISGRRERKRPVYAATVYNVPKNYHAAVNHPMASRWIEAIDEEVKSITKHSVWKVVKIPQDANLLGSTWVFREKENSEGEVV